MLPAKTVSDSKSPRRRRAKVRRRLLQCLKEQLSCLPRAIVLNRDEYFEAVLRDCCLTPPPTLATCQFILNEWPFTVVVVPDRVWHNKVSMAPIAKAAKRMHQVGRECILLPRSGIETLRTFASKAPYMDPTAALSAIAA